MRHREPVNAIVTLDPEGATAAAEADRRLARGRAVGPLHGLPIAFKDTHLTRGMRTTHGSPLFADHVPDTDELLVERIQNAGAIRIGKTDVPDFAAGSHTFTPVFGATSNPYDLARSAGGIVTGVATLVWLTCSTDDGPGPSKPRGGAQTARVTRARHTGGANPVAVPSDGSPYDAGCSCSSGTRGSCS
ncbi:amidase family protein [Streptomyces nodosus]